MKQQGAVHDDHRCLNRRVSREPCAHKELKYTRLHNTLLKARIPLYISRPHFHSGLAPVLRCELRWSPTHRQWKWSVSASGSRTRGSTRSEPRAGERRRGQGILAPSFTKENLPSRAWIHSTDRPTDRQLPVASAERVDSSARSAPLRRRTPPPVFPPADLSE